MHRVLVLIVAAACAAAGLAVIPGSAAASVGPAHVYPATGHVYRLLYGLSWVDAEAYASALGGHLVTINDAAEDAWLEATFPEPNLWIGLTDRAIEGTWVWASGEPVTYTNWCPGQPDDWQQVGGEDYGFINGSYCDGWDDAGNGAFDGIIELSAVAGTAVSTSTRTVNIPPFVFRWDAIDPEAVTYVSWNGSENLTRTATHQNCPNGGLSEFWGTSWGAGDGIDFVAPVGWGGSGTWTPYGLAGVEVSSATTSCYGTSGIPIRTTYSFIGGSLSAGRIQVERRFDFGNSSFSQDLRPYMPRLSPAATFFQVLYPGKSGVLVTRASTACGLGCTETDWAGTWFAIHDPWSGRGLVVLHQPSAIAADLIVDADSFSDTSDPSVLLRMPPGGFTGVVVERELLCFYDRSTWMPSTSPPLACTKPWIPGVAIGSKLGTAAASRTYTAELKTTPLGGYVTWQANLGIAAAAKPVSVFMATRRTDGTWTAFSRLTTRVADGAGTVTFSWRQTSARWVSVRFVGAGVTTLTSQARWR